MSDTDQNEPVREDAPADEPEQDQSAPVSNQRLRAILAGLVTVAILAVLAIAVFGDDDDNGNDPAPVATTAASDGTGGESGDGQAAGETNGEEPGGEELGSLALSGYLCPESSSEESECLDAGPVQITGAVVKLIDGRTFSLEGVEQGEDGMYAWLNIPIGEYTLMAESLTGPDGAEPRGVIGSNGQSAEGWIIVNQDPNQPAEVRVIFSPPGDGSPAAG